jgi:hypothetical protein
MRVPFHSVCETNMNRRLTLHFQRLAAAAPAWNWRAELPENACPA